MARPEKCKRICALPKRRAFICADDKAAEKPLSMTMEEYETIRLIDYVGLTQEECAAQMAVARTTIQRIYDIARKKMAQFLVDGGALQIEGGSYTVCKHKNCQCAQCRCSNRRCDRVDVDCPNPQDDEKKDLP